MSEEQIKEYDLIFSLGGSCAAACQLDKRKLRFASLPLDYTFFRNETSALRNLAEAFDTNFEKFLLKENLEELKGAMRGADHNGKMQYIDTYTKYRWINHFPRPIEEIGAYKEVKETIDRRIKRWITFLSESKKVLAILTNATEIPAEEFKILTECFKRHFPNLEIEYRYIKFEAPNNEIRIVDNITIVNVPKPQDFYDFAQTNYYWRFLDFCKLTDTLAKYKKNPKQQQSKALIENFEQIATIGLDEIKNKTKFLKKKNKLKVIGYSLLFAFAQIPFFEKIFKDKKIILTKILKYWE